jgi:mono/diheme cytochrome c family protein
MKTWIAAVALLMPGLALANPYADGAAVFQTNCAACHGATQETKDGKALRSLKEKQGQAPDLSRVLRRKPVREVRAFIENPWKVKPDTGCDTRMLKGRDLENLLTYLTARARPAEPAVRERRKQNLRKALEWRKAHPKKKRLHGHGEKRGTNR